MKQKLLLLLSFVMLLVGKVAAEVVTIDLTAQGYTNNQAVTTLTTSEGVTLTFDKGTGNTPPAYYNNGTAVRLYAGGTLTVSATKNITGITFTFGSSDGTNALTANVGTFETPTWSGSATDVVFTVDGTKGHRRFSKLEVTLSDEGVAVAKPTITGTTPFFGSTDITLACTTDGASLYYTTDGTEPTAASTAYTSAFSITEACTVKAIAIKGEDKSSVASKTFTAGSIVADIAALNALADKTPFQFTGDAYVVANPVDSTGKATSYIYIKDATGSSLIYDYALAGKLTVGQHIAVGWTGTVSIYNGLFEATSVSDVTATDAAGETVTYPEVELSAVTTDNLNQVVTLKGVTYVAPTTSKSFTITKGESSITGYNGNNIKIAAPADGKTYDIVGVISCYKTTAQLQPISITQTPEVKAVTISPATGTDISEALATAEAEITNAGDKVGSITINLAAGGTYTISTPIEASAAVTISGDATTLATIDASALTKPMIQMTSTPAVEANDKGFYSIGDVKVENVKITGLAYQLFYANKQKYLIDNLVLSNSIVQVDGTNKKTTFDTNGGGVIGTLDIKNSTIYADPQHKGQLFSSQSGQKADEAGLDKQTFSIQNSTLYNLSYAANVMSHRTGDKLRVFVVKNNIILDCGKENQFCKGLNQAQDSANPTWDVDGNSFLRTKDGTIEDRSTEEVASATKFTIQNTVTGVTTFKDLTNGDFTIGATSEQARLKVGDPRWLVDYIATGINTIDTDTDAADGKWYTLDGVMIEKPAQKGIYIHNGKKVTVK